MIARVVKYHSIAEWNFSLWFALQGRLAGAAAVSLHLREFVRNSRILLRLRPAQIELHNFSSLVNRVLRTTLAFDVLILRQRKAIQDYETDTRNIEGGRSGVSIDELDSVLARSTVRSNGNRKRSAFRFLRSVLATPLYVFATSGSRFSRSAGSCPRFFCPPA